jgi:hypothetical protein
MRLHLVSACPLLKSKRLSSVITQMTMRLGGHQVRWPQGLRVAPAYEAPDLNCILHRMSHCSAVYFTSGFFLVVGGVRRV